MRVCVYLLRAQVFREVNSQQEGLRGAARLRRCCRHQRRHRPEPPGRLEQAFGAQEAPLELRLCHVSVTPLVRSFRGRLLLVFFALLSIFGAFSHAVCQRYLPPPHLPPLRSAPFETLSFDGLAVFAPRREKHMQREPGLNPAPLLALRRADPAAATLFFFTDRFVDIDAFVMNPMFKLEWLLDVAKKQQQTGGIDGWGELKKRARVLFLLLACLLLFLPAPAAPTVPYLTSPGIQGLNPPSFSNRILCTP